MLCLKNKKGGLAIAAVRAVAWEIIRDRWGGEGQDRVITEIDRVNGWRVFCYFGFLTARGLIAFLVKKDLPLWKLSISIFSE